MARYETSEPLDIGDRLLWRDAQRLLTRHTEADQYGSCVWCGDEWPCAPRRLAERGQVAARRPWPAPPADRWPDPWESTRPHGARTGGDTAQVERSRWSDLVDYASHPR